MFWVIVLQDLVPFCPVLYLSFYDGVEKALHNGAIDATSTPQYRPAKTKKRAKGSGAVEEVVEAQDRETQMRIDMSDSENDDADTSTSPRFPPRLLRILRPLSKKLRMANRNVSRIVNVEGYNGGDDDTGAPSVFGFGAGSIPRLSRPMSVELQTCLRDVNYDSLAARGFVVGERALSTEERRRLIDDTCAYFRYDIRRTHRSRRRSKSMVLRGDDDDAGEEEGDKRSIDNDEGRSTSLRDVSRRFLHRAIEMQTQPLQAIGFLQLLLHENAASMIALPRQISRAQSAAVRRRRFIDSRCSSAASPIHDANPSVLYYCPSCHTIKNLFEEEEYGYLDMAIRSCEIGSESSAVCTATSSKGAGCGHVPVLRYETVNTTSETSCICVIRGIGYVTTTCCARVLPMHRVVFDDARSHALICAACLARTVENGRVGGVLSAVSKQEEGKREKTETRARSLADLEICAYCGASCDRKHFGRTSVRLAADGNLYRFCRKHRRSWMQNRSSETRNNNDRARQRPSDDIPTIENMTISELLAEINHTNRTTRHRSRWNPRTSGIVRI
ncbi:hypothetical protein CYMTET_2932 [Cymbomonas tetramitiformis]|uniref:Uncharacterized protein n=1 Tax=Cymbomonas tetramitiformis TaxID=36881 RepID=A0AAE0H4B5_9CHLO|nr:hypothetical protein CYMTET_2932 [Cymbomonas tetramitiformis]